VLQTRWKLNLLFGNLALDTYSFTVTTGELRLTPSSQTLGTMFFDAIISNHTAPASTLEALARLRVLFGSCAFAGVANCSFVLLQAERSASDGI